MSKLLVAWHHFKTITTHRYLASGSVGAKQAPLAPSNLSRTDN